MRYVALLPRPVRKLYCSTTYFQGMFCACDTLWYETRAEQRCKGDKVDRTCGSLFQIRVSLLQNAQTSSGAHPAFHSMGTGSLTEVKWRGCQVDRSRPYGVEVKNEWIYTSTAPVTSPRVDRSNDMTQSVLLDVY